MPQPNPLTIARVLDKAADLIEPEGAWTQGEYARDAQGIAVRVPNKAACFCLYGALNSAAGSALDGPVPREITDLLMKLLPRRLVPWAWNDERGRTQAEVVAKLREAAAKARESAQ